MPFKKGNNLWKKRVNLPKGDSHYTRRLGVSLVTRRKMSDAHKGMTHSAETRKKISEQKKGEKSHFWKGGITLINKLVRDSIEYSLWRESIFKRDDYTCQFCSRRGGYLEVDHIKPFAFYPELRFAIDNGRILCRPCHETTFKNVETR